MCYEKFSLFVCGHKRTIEIRPCEGSPNLHAFHNVELCPRYDPDGQWPQQCCGKGGYYCGKTTDGTYLDRLHIEMNQVKAEMIAHNTDLARLEAQWEAFKRSAVQKNVSEQVFKAHPNYTIIQQNIARCKADRAQCQRAGNAIHHTIKLSKGYFDTHPDPYIARGQPPLTTSNNFWQTARRMYENGIIKDGILNVSARTGKRFAPGELPELFTFDPSTPSVFKDLGPNYARPQSHGPAASFAPTQTYTAAAAGLNTAGPAYSPAQSNMAALTAPFNSPLPNVSTHHSPAPTNFTYPPPMAPAMPYTMPQNYPMASNNDSYQQGMPFVQRGNTPGATPFQQPGNTPEIMPYQQRGNTPGATPFMLQGDTPGAMSYQQRGGTPGAMPYMQRGNTPAANPMIANNLYVSYLMQPSTLFPAPQFSGGEDQDAKYPFQDLVQSATHDSSVSPRKKKQRTKSSSPRKQKVKQESPSAAGSAAESSSNLRRSARQRDKKISYAESEASANNVLPSSRNQSPEKGDRSGSAAAATTMPQVKIASLSSRIEAWKRAVGDFQMRGNE